MSPVRLSLIALFSAPARLKLSNSCLSTPCTQDPPRNFSTVRTVVSCPTAALGLFAFDGSRARPATQGSQPRVEYKYLEFLHKDLDTANYVQLF